MKILAISNLYPPDIMGGYEVCCRQAVEALRERGHDVRVLTSSPRNPSPEEPGVERTLQLTEMFSDAVNARSAPEAIRWMDFGAFRLNAFNVDQLFRSIDRFRPDAAYVCNLVGLGGLGLMAAIQHVKLPWVWQLGDSVPLTLCRTDRAGENLLAREVSRQLRGSFIAVSRRLVDEIEAGGVALGPDLTFLPNWIVGERAPLPPPRRPGEPLRIVTAGRLGTDKGIDLLIRAAGLLRDRGHLDFEVEIIGRLQDRSLVDLRDDLGLEGRVRFAGPMGHDALIEAFGSRHLFAFPTAEREPFGVVPIEAASRGCLPLISRSCGVAEWLVDGVHCLKVERTAAAFADRIERVLTGEIDPEPIRRRVHAALWNDFHIDAILPKIEAILTRAAARPRTGAGRPEEFHRLALIAERVLYLMAQEIRAA